MTGMLSLGAALQSMPCFALQDFGRFEHHCLCAKTSVAAHEICFFLLLGVQMLLQHSISAGAASTAPSAEAHLDVPSQSFTLKALAGASNIDPAFETMRGLDVITWRRLSRPGAPGAQSCPQGSVLSLQSHAPGV